MLFPTYIHTAKEEPAVEAYVGTRTTAQLGTYLDNILFPCSRMEILRCAEDNEAPDVMLDAIEDLPERRYCSVTEIIRSIPFEAS